MKSVDVIAELKRRQGDRSLREFARELEVTAPYLHDLYAGKRTPGPKILTKLGLEQVVVKAAR